MDAETLVEGDNEAGSDAESEIDGDKEIGGVTDAEIDGVGVADDRGVVDPVTEGG